MATNLSYEHPKARSTRFWCPVVNVRPSAKQEPRTLTEERVTRSCNLSLAPTGQQAPAQPPPNDRYHARRGGTHSGSRQVPTRHDQLPWRDEAHVGYLS